MKKLLFLSAPLLLAASVQAQTTIAQWTFENTFNSLIVTNVTSVSGINPEVGSGSASAVHASATAFSSPSGNGSTHSFSANTWAVGDYYQFQVSTVGFTNISVSYSQTSSGTGPGRFDFAYSTDGVNFTGFQVGYTVLANASPNPTWSTSTPHSEYVFSYNLSGILALENAPNVYFRVSDSATTSAAGGTTAAGGTDRIDDFTVVSGATTVPEPGSVALLGSLGLAGYMFMRRRSK